MPSRAEIRLDVLRYAADAYREKFIAAFEYAMDGEAVLLSKQVRKQLNATNITYWMELKAKDRQAQNQLAQQVALGQAPPEALKNFQGEADRQLKLWLAAELVNA